MTGVSFLRRNIVPILIAPVIGVLPFAWYRSKLNKIQAEEAEKIKQQEMKKDW